MPKLEPAVQIINRQRRLPIDRNHWERFTEEAISRLGMNEGSVTVVFLSDRSMRKLNQQFRGINETTDVLSFSAARDTFEDSDETSLGDIVISIQRAEEQAKEHGLDLSLEVAQLILHGLLHLCGYDHSTDQGEMNRLELRLRAKLGI